MNMLRRIVCGGVMSLAAVIALGASASIDGELFKTPPDSARPWVYWYFMDGNTTREGMKADLDAMKKAGIGGVLPASAAC